MDAKVFTLRKGFKDGIAIIFFFVWLKGGQKWLPFFMPYKLY